MPSRKHQMIAAGFAVVQATRMHRLAAPWTRGRGAILMLHHVRPWRGGAFAPNRLLEITPEFLDAALRLIKARGFDLLSMDGALDRLRTTMSRPFVVLTFDDGYRDNVDHALPILERHAAPFVLYVTTGFADRTARLWWVELEMAIAALDHVTVAVDAAIFDSATRTPQEKQAAFAALYWMLRAGPEDRMLAAIGDLLDQARLKSSDLVASDCLDWAGIQAIAAHPLCTIGVHTLTHPMLAKHDMAHMRREVADSRAIIETRIGGPARHLAYPVGDPGSAGPREFAAARDLGFASAVTTRPGMVFDAHRDHALALPRLSVNGNWQTIESLDMLLSGLPFAIWNRGRTLNVT